MKTKADLELEVVTLTNRLAASVTRQAHALEDVARFQGSVRDHKRRLDNVRCALGAFAAAECPHMNLEEATVVAMPAALMEALGVRPEVAPATSAVGQRRDVLADILKHLHGLVS